MGKIVEPVPVPHDGPLQNLVWNNLKSKSLTLDIGIPEALDLLDVNDIEENLEVRVIKDLKESSSLGGQLACLRMYRSTLLNLRNAVNNNKDVDYSVNSISYNSRVGMYRFLLEFGFSARTPHSLKRSIESCISALASSTFVSDEASIYNKINEAVVRSLLDPAKDSTPCWSNGLQTLFDILSFGPALSIVMQNQKLIIAMLGIFMSEGNTIKDIVCNHYHSENMQPKSKILSKVDGNRAVGVVDMNVLRAIEKGVDICTTLKLFLSIKNQREIIPACKRDLDFQGQFKLLLSQVLRCIVIPLIKCKATSSDSLNVCSVSLALLLLLLWTLDGDDIHGIADEAKFLTGTVVGIKAQMNADKCRDVNIPEELDHLPQLNRVAVVKGLAATLPDSVLSSKPTSSENESLLLGQITSFILHVAHVSTENGARLLALKGLETVLGRWKAILSMPDVENMNERARKLSNEVLTLALATWESPPSRQISSAVPGVFHSLVKLMEILDKRSSIVGEQKSIELLVSQILSQPASRKGRYVALETLLPKVGAKKMIILSKFHYDRSGTTLISSLIFEIGRGGNTSGAVAELLAKMVSMLRVEMHEDAGIDLRQHQEGNKKERRKKERLNSNLAIAQSDKLNNEHILLLDSWNEVWAPPLANALLESSASFRNQIASFCLPLLATFVGGKGNRIDASHAFSILLHELRSKDNHISTENKGILIWAKLEVIRNAHILKLLKFNASSSILTLAISQAVPLDLLKRTLFHEESKLRLATFQSIEPILCTYDKVRADAIHYLQLEVNMWKEALPYALKCSDKDYVVSLTETLRSFLDRISNAEADLPGELLLSFVRDYLLENIFVKQAAYPGTVAEKEKWALSMIHCVLSFATQHKFSVSRQKKPSKHRIERRLSANQQHILETIFKAMLEEIVLGTLITLMNSIWDSTRSSAYQVVLQILHHAVEEEMLLPEFLSDKASVDLFQARAIHLASSPRQREADTGARMLSVICATMKTPEAKQSYLEIISDLLMKRIVMMESSLGLFVENRNPTSNDEQKELPLAHGLIQSIRLIVENLGLLNTFDASTLYETMMRSCFRAIEVSLVVVADTKEIEMKDNSYSQDRWKIGKQTMNIPLNVNTGAIGANTFASLNPTDEKEKKKCLLKQRIIMGTWLLVKEACSALSSILASFDVAKAENLNTAGNLLITTLTSLKHQGAAFAAHKALQRLCSICYAGISSTNISLPSLWSNKLLHDITSKEMVRDSTLRRSTGYGLGFLSILRAETVSPHFLFPHVLAQILMISLPPYSVLMNQIQRWNLTLEEMFIFSREINQDVIADHVYEERSRIHALNILRLIILDAPLATEMRQFVGDSIIVSLIGYQDSSWAIRNSATMCFAAAILRVVDADKNADTNLTEKNLKRTTNAVTCKELFRCYPPLAIILLSLIKEENSKKTFNTSLHPALFPLLLLLARLQPLSLQRTQSGDNALPNLFIDPIIECLGHVHHKVRIVAARSLAVLSSDDYERERILEKCIDKFSIRTAKNVVNYHNMDHGVLLAVKCLLASSGNPNKLMTKSVIDAILHYSTWCNFEYSCPPSCTAVALDAWYFCTSVYQDKETKGSLLETSFKVARAVEKMSTSDGVQAIIGLSDLGKISSQCVCNLAFSYIFDPTSSSKIQERSIQMVEYCFTSINFDVMLYSVKAFKKGVYDAVQKCATQSDRKNDAYVFRTDVNILKIVGNLAIRCISHLLSRDRLKAHPPTLRRLSRLALECIHVFKYSSISKNTLFVEIIETSVDDMWEMCLHLLSIGGYKLKEHVGQTKAENLSGGNALAGNALELTSFLVYNMSQDTNNANGSVHPYFLDRVEIFTDLVCQSLHPLSNWKMRHSAAISVRESGLIHMPAIPQGEVLCLELFQLFQDSDNDVRIAAGKAMLLSRTLPTVALKNLQLASSKLCDFSTVGIFNRILGRLVSLCNNAEKKLPAIIKEYNITSHSPKIDSILNLNMERKIFEEEDPNPSLEILVILHASIITLSNFRCKVINENETQLFQDLFKICSRLLGETRQFVGTRKDKIDIAHNLTFNGDVFTCFHGSILGTALGLWYGVQDKSIVDDARDLLSAPSSSMHPCISQALQVLVGVQPGDERSKNAIFQNCFLTPIQTSLNK